MRRINKWITIIVTLLMVVCLAGCAEGEDKHESNENYPEEIDVLDIPENLLAFYLVFSGKKPFVSVGEGCQEFYWNEYYWCQSEPVPFYEPERFIVVDMDCDGVEEIMLYSWPESTQVLDYQDDKVYLYQFVFRGMNSVLPNGVYMGSGGASIWGFYRITEFDHGTFQEERLAYTEAYGDYEYYEVEGREVTSQDFNEYTEQFEVERAEEYIFTEELLNKVLLGDLSEEELAVVKNVPIEKMPGGKDADLTSLSPELKEILADGGAFICANDNRNSLYLKDGFVKGEKKEEEYQVLYYSIVDMDGDEIPEIVLTCYYNTTLILHQSDEGVRGYRFSFDYEVGPIADNGSFAVGYGIYGAKGYGRILSFGENGCETEDVDEAEFVGAGRVRYYSY